MHLIGNFYEHPSNPRYTVFIFYQKDQSDYFRTLLQEKNIWFEEDQEKVERGIKYLFGVKRTDLSVAKKLNYITVGLHREPFIGNKYLRFFVILISAIVMTLALIGFFKTEW